MNGVIVNSTSKNGRDKVRKYIIWGAGFRGVNLLRLLSKQRVEAFIESNCDQEIIEGVSVISFEQYLEKYRNFFLILSMVESKDVISLLINEGITNYCILNNSISEFKGYGVQDLSLIMDSLELTIDPTIIVGSDIYSILLYEKLEKIGCREFFLYSGDIQKDNYFEKELNIQCIDNKSLLELKGYKIIVTTEDSYPELNIISQENVIKPAYNLSYIIQDYYRPELEHLKGKYREKRCFIVATGPSLRVSDLDLLYGHNEICFSMNRVFNQKMSKWTPDFYVAVDNKFISEYFSEIKRYGTKTKFINQSVEEYVDLQENSNIFPIHCVTFDDRDNVPPFSEKIEYVVYGGATVAYACIQIAVYMGFNPIYLLGVDCNYVKGGKNNYFFEEKKADNIDHAEEKMINSFISAKKYADSHGIKIYNATRGGMLEVFDRVDFNSLF